MSLESEDSFVSPFKSYVVMIILSTLSPFSKKLFHPQTPCFHTCVCIILSFVHSVLRECRLAFRVDQALSLWKTSGKNKIHSKAKRKNAGTFLIKPPPWTRVTEGWFCVLCVPLGEDHPGLQDDLRSVQGDEQMLSHHWPMPEPQRQPKSRDSALSLKKE